MANSFRLLILLFFSFVLFTCSSKESTNTESPPEVALLECKPINWPDGSTTFSIYATIGSNQTKVAQSQICAEMSSNEFLQYSGEADNIVSMLECEDNTEKSIIYLEKNEDGYAVKQIMLEDSSSTSIASFKNGKFYFLD